MTDRPPIDFNTPTQFLPKVGPRRAELLGRLGLKTAGTLLYHFPRDYESPAVDTPVDLLVDNVPASLVGEVVDADAKSFGPRKSMFAALVENESGIVRLVFFNQPYRFDQMRLGTRVMISGTPKLDGLRWQFTHPKVTILGADETVPRPRPLAVYPTTEGLKQNDIRVATDAATAALASTLEEAFPAWLRDSASGCLNESGVTIDGALPDIATAIRDVHHAEDMTSLRRARLRLIFQELFVMQLALAIRRRRLTTDLRAPSIDVTPAVASQITDRFGFELTGDQWRAVEDIRTDMARQFPMNRMVQGDVGSGKTVVAAFAMLAAAREGYQSVIMAPTEVLARQHHRTLSAITDGTPHRIGLLCGSMTAGERREVERGVSDGSIELLIGTQALIHGDRRFANLGLCVVDEQHKFGVGQRVTLRGGGIDPHYLVMSATPIPRSLAMTMFGDVDVSIIRDKPPGRGKVNTYLAKDGWRDRWWSFVRERLDEGRQAFVVAPRVDATPVDDAAEKAADEPPDAPETTDGDVSSVRTVFEELTAGPLSAYRVELLHGRMDPDEKADIMRRFADADIDVLVTTTVIEVGIDVPNATVMTIMGAERFGLAQLHQLRGRIGRGGHAGHVAVFTDGKRSPEENERLAVFESTDDGFELAEADFRLRGPGDVLGRRQSGLPQMRIADLIKDTDVLIAARELARRLIEDDPSMTGEGLDLLKRQVMTRFGKRMNLSDAA